MGQWLAKPSSPRVRLPNASPSFLAGARRAMGELGMVEDPNGLAVLRMGTDDHDGGYMAVVQHLVNFQALTSV